MKLVITNTDQITVINNAACRVWHGVTADGIPCTVFVHRIAVRDDRDSSQFERELTEQQQPLQMRHLLEILK